jgi:L-asparaginase II
VSAPVLLDVTRGGLVESRHRGELVVLGATGEVSVALGDPDTVVYGRSSLKPLQAATMVECGWPGSMASIALAAASHDGEEIHLIGVRETLRAAGLSESALGCPPDLPMGRAAMQAWVAAGGGLQRICHNCSGKHAAMVATCVAAGWPVETYLDRGHPLQEAIRERVAKVSGAPVTATSVDGCGAPAHALPLVALARAFAQVASAAGSAAEGRVAAAMRTHPQLVGGTARAVSHLLAEVDGLVCKDGAEGMWAAALPDGRAFAVKISDGASRALPPVLTAVLRHWGFDGPAVRHWSAVPVLGGGAAVGAITWSSELRAALGV